MGENYVNLKRKLENLGYNFSLPVEGIPLVECVLADLLQTTRSLQHYMELSKEALQQRDTLMLEVEPYKNDNAKLLQENNLMHREIIQLKEDNSRISKESRRKIQSITDELHKKEALLTKLQHDVRDLTLRGICAETQSSRNRSKRKDSGDECKPWAEYINNDNKELADLNNKLKSLQDLNTSYADEIILLKSQVEHRNNEIIRLNILLKEGRPLINKNKCSKVNVKHLQDMECLNESLKKQVNDSLEKQHEAMQQALILADKNKCLQDELHKVESLALRVEEECNARINTLLDEITSLQLRNQELSENICGKSKKKIDSSESADSMVTQLQWNLNTIVKEKEMLGNEVKCLLDLNKHLQEKIESLSLANKEYYDHTINCFEKNKQIMKCPTKDELQKLLESERKMHETYMNNIEQKLSEAMQLFNKHLKCNENEVSSDAQYRTSFVRDLQAKLCETEQKVMMLKKEIDEKDIQLKSQDHNNKQNYKDIVKQLNDENAELVKENLCLSKELNHYKNIESFRNPQRDAVLNKSEKLDNVHKLQTLRKENDEMKNILMNSNQINKEDIIKQLNDENSELSKENIYLSQQLNHFKKINVCSGDDNNIHELKQLKAVLEQLTREKNLLSKDKQEYNLKYKEAMDLVNKYKRDLILKQKEIDQLQEENGSYKMTHRNGKASVDHLREECNFLRQQIKMMKSDVIKEKTMANQIKNIQLETERSSNEIQNELLCLQKKFSLSKETVEKLERKCKDLQSEISSLQSDKSNLIDNIKRVDKERDKLVIELDLKTEANSALEKKISKQMFEISKLDQQILEMKRLLSFNKVAEHKVMDSESQIQFLNGEISRISQQFDNAMMENKHLQNSLADANGELKITKIEYEKSRKQVAELRQQLQHYVAEIRRIEELLSHKEAERSDMLEHFASLSVEANILENTNHSLESESASKSLQLQSYVLKIQELEDKLLEKENKVKMQATHVSDLMNKINHLEQEVKLMAEEKTILEENVAHLKQMCNNMQRENNAFGDASSELQLYETKIRTLSTTKSKLEMENDDLKEKLQSSEKLLSNARKEVIELKLALQDATSETQSLQELVNSLRKREMKVHETHEHTSTTEEYRVPFMIEETVHEDVEERLSAISEEEIFRKRFSKYTHGSTL